VNQQVEHYLKKKPAFQSWADTVLLLVIIFTNILITKFGEDIFDCYFLHRDVEVAKINICQ